MIKHSIMLSHRASLCGRCGTVHAFRTFRRLWNIPREEFELFSQAITSALVHLQDRDRT